ncbi:FBD-associated F-box protein At4g10400-like [Rutidosis leptorrhynchoides]|uniref:FBD-associated F-box protein At4g10400-like n=1 Tax=Rutidosis leptorrhynchoides TaxID=125765 RepID=UPI003A9A3C5E
MNVSDSLDRISKLPDEVLSRILSHLPTKEAVKTSVLSKRWEYIWTSTPNLEFSDKLLLYNEIVMFKEYVHSVLSNHSGSTIEKCSLLWKSGRYSDHRYAWICAVLYCGIQEFHLQSWMDFEDLPWCMFTSKSLVSLKIEGRFVLNLPRCVCLLNLKILHLDSVIYVDDASAKKLFSGCPCLQELEIKRRRWDGVQILSISIPSLKRLSICFEYCNDRGGGHVTMIDTPNLEYLTLNDDISEQCFVSPLSTLIEARLSRKCGYQILKGIRNVRLLALCGKIMESLHAILQVNELPIFEHLARLELGVGEYVDWRLLPNVLESAPNLEELIFPKGLVSKSNHREYRRFYWAPPEHVPECLLFRLKTIEVQKFVGVPCEVHLMKYLLESSRFLKKATIHYCNFGKRLKMKKNFVGAKDKITNAPRASDECEIEFILMNKTTKLSFSQASAL